MPSTQQQRRLQLCHNMQKQARQTQRRRCRHKPLHLLPAFLLLQIVLAATVTNVNANAIVNLNAKRPAQQLYYNHQHLYNRLPAENIAANVDVAAVGIGVDALPARHAAAKAAKLQSFNLIAGEREDICKHCKCENVTNFRTVYCDYRKNHGLTQVFGSNFDIPHGVTAISIKLAPKIKFELREGFFRNRAMNIVNSFIIEGVYDNDQVELAQNAFQGNRGGYPDIKIINVSTVFVKQNAFSAGEIKFKVQNCAELNIFTDAFTNVNMSGTFEGIQEMNIREKAFNSAHAKLRIVNSTIPEITRFEASVHEIRFIDSHIGVIRRHTFDVTKINLIVFDKCHIETIETRAITDKLHSNHVSFTNAVIGVIDKEAIYGSGIAELVLTNNTITSINDKAIAVHSVNVTIAQNEIKHLGHDWLTVMDWAKIVVEQNKFGYFGNMALQVPQHPADCSFESNSLTLPQPGSLNISNCRIHKIAVKTPCTCNLHWLKVLTDHDLRSETYCTIDHTLEMCFNTSSFNTLKYINEVCDENKKTLSCIENRKVQKVNGDFYTPEELEQHRSSDSKIIILVTALVASAVVLLAIAVTSYVCCCRRGRGRRSKDDVNDDRHLHEFSLEERHIIQQTLQRLQHEYPNIYKPVNEHTKQLLKQNITESRCLTEITEIVQLLKNVPESGNSFVTFDRVLTEHLQRRVPSAPPTDPIYTEPGQAGVGQSANQLTCGGGGIGGGLNGDIMAGMHSALSDGGDYYTSSAIVMGQPLRDDLQCGLPSNLSGANCLPVCDLQPEHIYAEPSCAQQPLLRNEYASPADRHLDSGDLYTEPINERDVNNMPPAYEAKSTVLPTTTTTTTKSRLPQYATPKRKQTSSNNNNNNIVTTHERNQQNPKTNLSNVLYQRNNSNNGSIAAAAAAGVAANSRGQTHVRRLAKDLEAMPTFNPDQLSSTLNQRHLYLPTPTYTVKPNNTNNNNSQHNRTTNSKNNRKQMSTDCYDGAAAAAPSVVVDAFELDMRGAAALPPDAGSNHSGGSNETVKIDDIIEYADA